MIAKEIMPKSVYAARIEHPEKPQENLVVRFLVKTVVTINRRSTAKGSPHDYQSHVEGHIDPTDYPVAGADREKLYRLLPLDAVLGPIAEYQELIDKKRREDEAAAAADRLASEQCTALRAHLYDRVGQPAPARAEEYGQLFRAEYHGHGMTLSVEGVAALLAALK